MTFSRRSSHALLVERLQSVLDLPMAASASARSCSRASGPMPVARSASAGGGPPRHPPTPASAPPGFAVRLRPAYCAAAVAARRLRRWVVARRGSDLSGAAAAVVHRPHAPLGQLVLDGARSGAGDGADGPRPTEPGAGGRSRRGTWVRTKCPDITAEAAAKSTRRLQGRSTSDNAASVSRTPASAACRPPSREIGDQVRCRAGRRRSCSASSRVCACRNSRPTPNAPAYARADGG